MKSRRGAIGCGQLGYSLIEMVMTLAVGLILASVALPTMISAIQSYRLNSVSQQVASLIELTRYTAIRRNSVIRARTTPDATVFFIDANRNGTLGQAAPMLLLPS